MALQTYTYVTSNTDRESLSSSENIAISLSSKIYSNFHTSIAIADDDDILCNVIKDCLVAYYNLIPSSSSLPNKKQDKSNKDKSTIAGQSFVTIHTVSNPVELESLLNQSNVDLCLLDLMFEGYGMIDPVGISARYPQTRFIVISGYLDNIKPDNLIFFAAKPFDTRYLARLIDLSLEFNLDNKNINSTINRETDGGSGYRQ